MSKHSENTAFSLHNVNDLSFPVLISVPHAGRVYPPEIKENLRVPAENLLRLEDRYADRLATKAISSSFPTIIAQKPRAWIDLNRNRLEIDPDMVTGIARSGLPEPSRKVRGGLGLVPRRLSGAGNLWREKWNWGAINDRIENVHEPYHHKVTEILHNIRQKFGCALLLDIHSMPPLHESEGAANIVIGDRFGRSAGSRYSEIAMAYFQGQGFQTRLNHPYAGGYILERHSKPEKAVHALQLEVDRRCYLDSGLREPTADAHKMAKYVAQLAEILAAQINGQFQLAAAE